jgi:hypothetical protein
MTASGRMQSVVLTWLPGAIRSRLPSVFGTKSKVETNGDSWAPVAAPMVRKQLSILHAWQ